MNFADGAESVVFRADFEAASPAAPPAGWSMWGVQKYKDPANFTRDAQQAHGGCASFRIHHPARTEGYVVSAPEAALHPQSGKTYTASFWARSDRAGEAVFGWTAYRQVKPFVDAPSPGSFPLAVDRQWRQFRFVLYEGWDFFAEDCRHLLLTFRATGKAEEEQTLWIDDVEVTEQSSQRDGRLVNPATLTYQPLEHRLQPGEQLSVTIDANQRLRQTRREVGGVSFHRVAGWPRLPFDKQGQYVLPAELEEAIRQMRLPMTRFYALGDEPFGLETAIDKAAEFLDRIGVNQAATPLEFEIQGATSKLTPEAWARGVRRNANIRGMMHRAVRLIHYLREDLLRGASSWEMFIYQRAPGFGFLAQDVG